MNHIDDDCTVITEMPLCEEVADFIDTALQSNKKVDLDELVHIYEKYRSTYLSYGLAEMTLFFLETIRERDDVHEMISDFVSFQ